MNTTKKEELSLWYLAVAILVFIAPFVFLLAPSDVQMSIHYKVVELSDWFSTQYYLHAAIFANFIVSMVAWLHNMKTKGNQDSNDLHRSNIECYFILSYSLALIVLGNYFIGWLGL